MSASLLALNRLPLLPEMPPANSGLSKRVQKLLDRAAHADLSLRYLGTMPLFNAQRIYRGDTTDWVVTNLANDPLFFDHFGFPIPRENLQQLAALKQNAILPDGLYVAHEVPAGTVEDGKRLRLKHVAPSAPEAVVKTSARFGAWSERLWSIAFPFATPEATADVTKQVSIALDRLDPILFGVVLPPRRRFKAGETAAWFFLTSWSYAGE